MNTNLKVIGLTRLEIKPKFTAPEANARRSVPLGHLIFRGKSDGREVRASASGASP